MAKYYILVKKKNSKNWLGAIPAKKGVTLKRLRKGVSGQVKKGYSYKIITSDQLKRLLKKMKPKATRKKTRGKRSKKSNKKATKRRAKRTKSRSKKRKLRRKR
jgi:hypothetical protein